VLSLVLTVSGLAFLEPLLRLFGATPAVLPYASEYLSVILGGSFFFAFAVSTNNIVRSEGNIKMAMVSMIIGAVVNVILDPILIFGLDMGIRGAAVATVIANCCSFVFLCGYFFSGASTLRIRREDVTLDFSLLPEVVAIGASSFTRVAAGSLVAIVLNNSIAHYGADVHLAVFGVSNRVMMFTFLPLIGIVQGLQPIVGFNYGARNMDRVREAVRKAVTGAVLIATLGFVVLMLFPRPLFALFSTDAELIAEGVGILRIIILILPLVGCQIIGASLFQALGKAWPALFLSMLRQVLFLIPLILVLPLRFGLGGIWAAFPVADALAVLVTVGWVVFELRHLEARASQPRTDPPEQPTLAE